MLRWYRRWRLTKEGALFRYYNGRRIVYGDVLSLYRRITTHEANIPALLDAVDAQQEPETTQFLNAVCDVFGLERYNEKTGRGLTEWEIIAVFVRFLELLESLKKKYSTWVRLIALYGSAAIAIPGFPRTPALLVAMLLCENETFYVRAWPIALGISMGLGDIPEDAFISITGDENRGRFEYQLYQARKEFYRDRTDIFRNPPPFAGGVN